MSICDKMQFFKETEWICGTDHLQRLVGEAWEKTWSNRIIEQANLERGSNQRLRDFLDSFQG